MSDSSQPRTISLPFVFMYSNERQEDHEFSQAKMEVEKQFFPILDTAHMARWQGRTLWLCNNFAILQGGSKTSGHHRALESRVEFHVTTVILSMGGKKRRLLAI